MVVLREMRTIEKLGGFYGVGVIASVACGCCRKLHYVKGNLEGLGVNMCKNTALNLLGMENLRVGTACESFDKWAGKPLAQRERRR